MGLFIVLTAALLDAGCAESRLPARFASAENQAVLELARDGHAEAQAALGEMYEDGRGGPPDYDAAATWYARAAAQGNALGEFRLGQLRETGQGVARDFAAAARLYRKAALHGSAPAAFRLGYLHEYGQGVARDVTEAAFWYQRAAEGWRAGGAVPLAPDHVLAGLDTTPTGPLADSGPRVHLASLRSADDAVATWRALQGRHPDILAGLGLALARLDLGEGVGVFYQVQAGPFADAAAARAACDMLHGRGQFCQPVAP